MIDAAKPVEPKNYAKGMTQQQVEDTYREAYGEPPDTVDDVGFGFGSE